MERMEKMKRPVFLKVFAMALMGFSYQAFGACQRIYGNFNLTSDVSTCYEIYGTNLTFNGNGHKITGSSAQSSNIVLGVFGYNKVTVKNVSIDCNTKTTGIEFDNAGSSNATDIVTANCYTGVQKSNTNLNVAAKVTGGNNMLNNNFDINSFDGTSTNIYTSQLDAASSSSTGFGIHVDTSPFYDYASQIYLKNVGVIANNNSFFWLDHSWFGGFNAFRDLMLYNIPAAYMSGVNYKTAIVSNTKIITF